MRRLSTAETLLKCLGIFLLVEGLTQVAAAPWVGAFVGQDDTLSFPIIYSMAAAALLNLIFGALLLFRTAMLTRWFGNTPDREQSDGFALDFPQAIQLLGLFFAVTGLTDSIASTKWLALPDFTVFVDYGDLVALGAPAVELLLGLLLLTRTRSIAARLQAS